MKEVREGGNYVKDLNGKEEQMTSINANLISIRDVPPFFAFIRTKAYRRQEIQCAKQPMLVKS